MTGPVPGGLRPSTGRPLPVEPPAADAALIRDALTRLAGHGDEDEAHDALAALDRLLAQNEAKDKLLRRLLSGEPWGAYARDGSGRTLEHEVRAALAAGSVAQEAAR